LGSPSAAEHEVGGDEGEAEEDEVDGAEGSFELGDDEAD
jgi:hypothetical protein